MGSDFGLMTIIYLDMFYQEFAKVTEQKNGEMDHSLIFKNGWGENADNCN